MESLDMPVGQLEGSLPPCLRIAVFGNRRAFWHDLGPHGESDPRFVCNVGRISEWLPVRHHPGVILPTSVLDVEARRETDDDKEAERLWLKAQRVLLGEAE
ncbi:hypothetical protein LCGC14_2972070 [marine sediment metagenome]|uniref:Uncharacterized protein n=1 Tax=marine sediment metagenome TaxID=412755 RepID=A0A0F8XA09_9ZZZZ